MNKGLFKLAFFSFAFAFLSGCSLFSAGTGGNSAPEKDPSAAVKIISVNDYGIIKTITTIETVDGKSVEKSNELACLTVQPGEHEFAIGFVKFIKAGAPNMRTTFNLFGKEITPKNSEANQVFRTVNPQCITANLTAGKIYFVISKDDLSAISVRSPYWNGDAVIGSWTPRIVGEQN